MEKRGGELQPAEEEEFEKVFSMAMVPSRDRLNDAMDLIEKWDAQKRVRSQLWVFNYTFPSLDAFVREVFYQRNLPYVMQTELRLVPVNKRGKGLEHML